MKTEIVQQTKAEILSNINKGIKKESDLIENSEFTENAIITELRNLVALNILKFNRKTNEYDFSVSAKGEKIILDGNILLPVTIIRKPEKTLVCRGLWYELPPDFDTNRIIWNVDLRNTTKSTLVDLLKLTQNKMKKSKIKQVEDYKKLVNLIIPYSDKIKFIINVVGEELTSIVMFFPHRLYFTNNKEDFIEYSGWKLNSEIKTEELINELRKKPAERDWSNIRLNNIFNFSDFIFSKNEIPYEYDGNRIEYAKLSRIRGSFKIDYYEQDNNGNTKNIGTDGYDNVEDGMMKIREIFDMYAKEYLEQFDILID